MTQQTWRRCQPISLLLSGASVTASGYDNVSGRPVSCCPQANKCCFTSPSPSKNLISIIFSPLQNLVRLGSKALLKLNSSAKTQARVANQKQWDINQQLKHYYLLAVSNTLYVFKMCTIFPNRHKCSLIDVKLHSKPDAGNVTLGCQ